MHSISRNVGIGVTVFKAWTAFCRLFAVAFSAAFDEAFRLFSADVVKRKAVV